MTTQYNNPTPVAVCLVRSAKRLLALRRGIAPKIGEMAFPGGFVDEMESAETAACRELMEETGIQTSVDDWYPVATRITPRNQLLVFVKYRHELFDDELLGFEPNEEALELLFVEPGADMAFPLHQDVLNDIKLWNKN